MRRIERAASAPSSPPASEPGSRLLAAVLEVGKLREIREALASGRVVGKDKRTPQEDVRVALFRTAQELLRFLAEFARRIGRGERLHIVEREHRSDPDRLVIEFFIEEARP